MSLWRTASTVRLKSDDGLYYPVSMVDEGDGIVIPEVDGQTPTTGTSDAYVALVGSDNQVYRWSLETIGPSDVQHLIELSPDQSEYASAGVDILFGSQWLRVKVEIQSAGYGIMIPNLIIVDGQPWIEPVRKGGISSFIRPTSRISTFRRPVTTFATFDNN